MANIKFPHADEWDEAHLSPCIKKQLRNGPETLI